MANKVQQIKTFTCSSTEEIEKYLNNFLANPSNYESIVNLHFWSCHTGGSMGVIKHFAIIVYT